MKRKEAKKMAQSRDCHCIKGKDRDTNYHVCIDKIFDWHESELKDLTTSNISNSLPPMNTAQDIRECFDKKLKQLQENCTHQESEWMEQYYAPAHSTGKEVKVCNICEKILDSRGLSQKKN